MKPVLVSAAVSSLAAVLLSACGGNDSETGAEKIASKLDQQAMEAGLIPDPETLSLAGQFETRSELGIDKLCATAGAGGFDIGMLAVFGPESKCEAQGRAIISDERVNITFRGEENCSFDAEYDGVEIRLPGALPEGCSSYCTPRASFSGTSYFMIAQGDDAARKTLGREIDRLCG